MRCHLPDRMVEECELRHAQRPLIQGVLTPQSSHVDRFGSELSRPSRMPQQAAKPFGYVFGWAERYADPDNWDADGKPKKP
jgi:hypothetical protein